ncbi:MAG: glycosyl transferase [Deltaproteobacteria bacterium]|nr:glycosyl transferase [Deltaproteobacteria bacterium]
MKIIIYCQHVLGVGHFFRTLEIARAMQGFEVTLVTGGKKVDAPLPDHVRHVSLPGLMMDKDFTCLHSVDPEKTVEAVKLERQDKLLFLIQKEKPDLFFIELYPFGRRAFRFELIPALDFIKDKLKKNCKVVCSLRDILVEKEDRSKYENRVINALNTWFDAVLVHSDPRLIKLDATFSSLDRINVPLFYTGFVTPLPDQEKVMHIRHKAELTGKGRLITVSAGGGNVGAKLLKAAVRAFNQLPQGKDWKFKVFTGPYMGEEDKNYLHSFAGNTIKVEQFSHDFVSLLAASDLSISMAGYNTCMNIVAANVPSLVLPFDQNLEQLSRAKKIAEFAPMIVLEDKDLEVPVFTSILKKCLEKQKQTLKINLNIKGALNTRKWIEEHIRN